MRRTPWVQLGLPAIERVWIEAASRCGFRVARTEAAYAATDGCGTIFVGEPHTLDEDDSLAQLVFHELCHALVQGQECWRMPDWGLDNTGDRDGIREQACLRLQARLADRHGLREAMTPTTEWRAYYRALTGDPLSATEGGEQEACALARAGLATAERTGLGQVLGWALAETAVLLSGADVGKPCGQQRPLGHPLGFELGPANESCGTCAWRYVGGRGTSVDRCRQSAREGGEGGRVERSFPACDRWEAPVDCTSCGACCREAYHTVSVSVRDPVVWKHPALIVRSGHRWSLLRAGERCAALEGGAAGEGQAYRCSIYEDRPRTCRDFERGGRHCLVARRRVGLSR
jgi:hypothetical protein